MPCVFNTKPEDRHCQYCTAVICDEKQPKPVETFATNKIKIVMTDKEIICAEIERLRKEYDIDTTPIAKYQIAQAILNRLSDVIDSMQEEPVSSIWHNASEHPEIDRTFLLVAPNGNSSLCLWGGKELHFVTLGGGHSLLCPNDKWAYIDDLLHKQEDPISEDLEEAYETFSKETEYLGLTYRGAFKAGARWQKLKIIYKAIIYNDKIYPTTYEDEPTEFCLDGGEEVRLITEAVNNGLLKQGDKVKVIIIKDE